MGVYVDFRFHHLSFLHIGRFIVITNVCFRLVPFLFVVLVGASSVVEVSLVSWCCSDGLRLAYARVRHEFQLLLFCRCRWLDVSCRFSVGDSLSPWFVLVVCSFVTVTIVMLVLEAGFLVACCASAASGCCFRVNVETPCCFGWCLTLPAGDHLHQPFRG